MAAKMQANAKSRILDAVHETASDLHRLGFIDKRKTSKFDSLCLAPVPEGGSKWIRTVREDLCGSSRR